MARIRSSRHTVVAAAATAAIMAVQPTAAQNRPAYLANFPNFAPKLTPEQLPGDVDTALKAQLEAKQEFAKVQRLFDLWSWQAFVSLNWPTDNHGRTLADAKDIAGGTLIYETKTGEADWRIFRIDDINLGQYSPTRPRRRTSSRTASCFRIAKSAARRTSRSSCRRSRKRSDYRSFSLLRSQSFVFFGS